MDDARSPLTLAIMNADPHAYEALVVQGGTPPKAHELLDAVKPQQLFTASATSSLAALAGLWLWHDGLDQAHTIAQNLHDATGSFWHAIVHRREGDFSNSKYWYARAARHPAFASLGMKAGAIVGDMPADRLLLRIIVRGFDPNAFVDLVEEIRDKPDDDRRRAAIRLQQLEWRTLFDHLR